MSKLGSALAHAARGWKVFPVSPDSKKPLVRWGEEATDDIEVIIRWWQRWPDANPAVACKPSGLVVFDCDVIKPDEYFAFPEEWQADGITDGADVLIELFCQNDPRTLPVLTQTRTVVTQSGGQHWYFAAPFDVEITNSQGGKFAPKIDIRAAGGEYGGYVLLPESTGSRGAYRLTRDVPPLPMPNWLIKYIQDKQASVITQISSGDAPDEWEVTESVGRILHKMRTFTQGTQNAMLYWSACEFRDLGLAEEYAVEQLWNVVQNWENTNPSFPWEAHHVIDTVRSAYRRPRRYRS